MREPTGISEYEFADPGKQARSASGLPVVPAFDGYRAFAIFSVVLLHMTTISGVAAVGREGVLPRMIWGTFGHAVEILFIVSGFVVFLPTVARQGQFGSLLAFAVRRGARLLPAYWLILLLSLPLIALFSPGFSELPGPRDLLLNFTGTMIPAGMFIPGISTGFSLNLPLWTLSVEIGFYLVLPLIAGAFFRKPLIGLLVALAITVTWTIAFDHVGRMTELLGMRPGFDELVRLKLAAGLQLPVWAYSFGLGMAGAWAWVRLSRPASGRAWESTRPDRASIVAAASAIALLLLAWLIGGNLDQTRQTLVLSLLLSTALAVFMVSLALVPDRWQRPFNLPVIRKLGDLSYGVYLSHMVIALTLASLISMPENGNLKSFLAWTLAVVPASILYGYLSARFFEQPIRRWARKYGRRETG